MLPRLKVLVDSGVAYDKIYIDNLKFSWQQESLDIVMNNLGIPKEKDVCRMNRRLRWLVILIVVTVGAAFLIPRTERAKSFADLMLCSGVTTVWAFEKVVLSKL